MHGEVGFSIEAIEAIEKQEYVRITSVWEGTETAMRYARSVEDSVTRSKSKTPELEAERE